MRITIEKDRFSTEALVTVETDHKRWTYQYTIGNRANPDLKLMEDIEYFLLNGIPDEVVFGELTDKWRKG